MNEIVKKNKGLRKSIHRGDHVPMPKAGKRICAVHGSRFLYQNVSNTWGCPTCDNGRVGLNSWYRETCSLGYINAQVYFGSTAVDGAIEVIVTRTSSTPRHVMLVQKIEHEGSLIVVAIDSELTVMSSVWDMPVDEDGIRWLTLRTLYYGGSVRENVEASDSDSDTTTKGSYPNVSIPALVSPTRNRIALGERAVEEIAKMPPIRDLNDLNAVVDFQ